MRSLHPPLLIALALLASCKAKEPADTANESAAVAEAPATAPKEIEPGLYRQDTTLLAFNDPSLPADQAASAARSVGTTQSQQSCLTPDRIANPRSIIMDSVEASCKVDQLTWEGGRIDVRMACADVSRSQAGVLALTGTYDGGRYDMDLKLAGPGGMGAHLKVAAKRIGPCQ